MRILMVLDHEFPPDIRVENEIDSLHKAGHEVHVACYTRKGKIAREETSHGIIHRKPVSVFLYKSSVACLTLPFYFRFWWGFVEEILTRYPFDAIHVHDLPLAYVGVEAKEHYGVKFVLDLHENWPAFVAAADHTNTLAGKILSPVRRWERYEREMVNKADRVIAVVEEMRDRLAANGAGRDRISIVPNTIRLGEYPDTKKRPDPGFVTFLYSGGIDNQRGLQIVVEGMPGIIRKYPGARLWIVGKGSFEQKLKERVGVLNISDHVSFWGWQKQDDMYSLIKQADIALIPYIRTVQTDCSSPNKLFQYMYAKKPVLASNCKSIERILKNTEAGICYVHDNIQDFISKSVQLIESIKAGTNMGENGYRAVMETYNWDATSSELRSLYNIMLK